MKLKLIFVINCLIMGFAVGLIAALFLALVNFLIDVIWVTIPGSIHEPSYYPLIVGIVGGLMIGVIQSKIGNYPRTIHETLQEFQTTHQVAYQKNLPRNFGTAVIVLSFGASLGPEAALAGIVGGLISWIGDRMRLTLAREKELLELGIGAMMATIFYAPLVGVSESLEERPIKFRSRVRKILLYIITTVAGIVGFTVIKHLFPTESVFAIRIPTINWQPQVLLIVVPALIVGVGFGYLFQLGETCCDVVANKIKRPILLALLAGIAIGVLGMVSPYFLFSGEHELLGFSKGVAYFSLPYILLIAVGKGLLTNLCFSFGWRGGKIFPAIFASTAMGFALTKLFPYTPGLLVSIVVAASVTIIIQQPYVTGALLLFLFPIQFFPFIIGTCLLANKFSKMVSSTHFSQ